MGGSLAGGPECKAWLDLLAEWGGPLILVPGGGPFADCVRSVQALMGLDDATAHRLALIAMGQFGIALAAHSDAFAAAATKDEIDATLMRGVIPVWLPETMAYGAQDLPACWDVTSDSLAAWLARAFHALRLLLIKTADIPAQSSACELVAAKIVDPAFPCFAAKAGAAVWVAGPASLAGAGCQLENGGLPGTFVPF
ncbi:MAG: hypothetical protein J2P49_02815 [Methylocapsa sp.]|nr:hypothetical protein [Methylocapsa sp.]